MKILLALTIIVAIASAKVKHPCHITGYRPPEQLGKPLEYFTIDALPEEWD